MTRDMALDIQTGLQGALFAYAILRFYNWFAARYNAWQERNGR